MKTNGKSNKKNLVLGVSAFVILVVFIIIGYKKPYQHDDGTVFNTTYHITYQSGIDYKTDIEKELRKVDAAFSLFNDTSIVSKLNRNQQVALNDYFITVFNKSQEISHETGGNFDITIAPFVNIWKSRKRPDILAIDSIKHFVSYKKVSLFNGKIIKKDPRVMMDFNAIAKGYGVDVVAMFLQSKGIKNYIIKIGNKIDAAGDAPKRGKSLDRSWHVSIDSSINDSLNSAQKQRPILKITDTGMATCINNYGTAPKYSPIIDPYSGFPVSHNLQSVTVLADNCMTADAYAASFMVMGMQKAIAFLNKHKELKAYFVYKGKDNKIHTFMTHDIHKMIAK